MEEVVSMDRKTRKILPANGCLHTRSNVARLYLPRKEGKRFRVNLGVYKGREWEVESSRYFWKRTVISRPWYCPYLEESVTCLSCGIAAEDFQKKNWRGSHHNNNNNKKKKKKKKKKNIFI